MNPEENLRTEYAQCFDNWRFLVGLRFTILAFFLTVTSGLFYVAFTLREASHGRALYIIVSFIGALASSLVWIMERRNKQLYALCIKRAMQIEEKWYQKPEAQAPPKKANEGLAHWIESEKASIWSSHSNGILGFYRTAFIIWVALFLASIFLNLNFPLHL